MTEERQDIREDFYSGNHKRLVVTCRNADGSSKNLTGSEVTYAMFDDDSEVVLVKSSFNGSDEVDITVPASGICVIKLNADDTINLTGTYRHHVNVVDVNGDEETVLTGRVEIFPSFARRIRKSTLSAFLAGG